MSSDLSLISQSFRDSAIRSGDGSGGGGRGGDIGSYNTNTMNFYVNQNGARRLEALKLLYDHMAHGALYNSSELSNSLDWQKDTRQAVIKEIEDWATADDVEPVLWLNGPAGSGKSSIAKRIAETLHDCGKLAGSFFFARLSTSVGRNDTTRLVATIAYQLSVSIPTIREHMADALDLDPNIFEKVIDTQMEDLVIKPLTKARAQMVGSQAANLQTGSNYPRIIILDGLDECGANATGALKALFSVLKGPDHLLSFLITSRPEFSLQMPFRTGRLDGNGGPGGPQIDIRRMVLDSRYDPDTDVKAFVNSCFESIKKSHPCHLAIPEDWPSPEDVDWLVGRSSGQFIYAHTVMNYVGSSDYIPLEQLARILPHKQQIDQNTENQALGADTPFAALDSLYTKIFQAVNNIHLQSALKIFTFILLRYTPVEAKVDLIQHFLGMTKGSVPVILKDLHSILHVPELGSSASVYLYHASLEDFLLDKGRSGVFFIDPAEGHAQLAIRCMQNIAQTAPSVQNDSIAKTSLKISYLELMAHCTASTCTPELLNALEELDFENYLNFAFGGQQDSSVQRDLWRQIGPFYEWVKLHLSAKEGRPEVYAKYLKIFDICLRERLERYQQHQFEHLISASTLPSFGRYSLSFFHLLFLEISPRLSSLEKYEALDDDGCMLRWLSSSKMSCHHSMITDFLTDVSRSKDFYVRGESYMKLIDFCVTFLNDSRLQNDGDEGKWPQWIMTKDLADYEECCLRIISDATKLVSNAPAFLETRNSKGPRGLPIPDNSRYFMGERREIMIRTIQQTLENRDENALNSTTPNATGEMGQNEAGLPPGPVKGRPRSFRKRSERGPAFDRCIIM